MAVAIVLRHFFIIHSPQKAIGPLSEITFKPFAEEWFEGYIIFHKE